MTEKEILKAVVEKVHKFGDLITMLSKEKEWDNLLKDNAYYGLIFSHKFAKAFWNNNEIVCPCCGEKLHYQNYDYYCNECGIEFNDGEKTIVKWQYHLQQMVLEEEPLNYLKKFLKSE